MISFILIALSALCNALMDVSQFHYSNSIFTKFNNPMYWDGSISWKAKYIDGEPSKGRRTYKIKLIKIKFILWKKKNGEM